MLKANPFLACWMIKIVSPNFGISKRFWKSSRSFSSSSALSLAWTKVIATFGSTYNTWPQWCFLYGFSTQYLHTHVHLGASFKKDQCLTTKKYIQNLFGTNASTHMLAGFRISNSNTFPIIGHHSPLVTRKSNMVSNRHRHSSRWILWRWYVLLKRKLPAIWPNCAWRSFDKPEILWVKASHLSPCFRGIHTAGICSNQNSVDGGKVVPTRGENTVL